MKEGIINFFQETLYQLIVYVISGTSIFLYKKSAFFGKKVLRKKILFFCIILIYIFFIVVHLIIAFFDKKDLWILMLYFFPPAIMLTFFITELNRFFRVGIFGADKQVRKGINYKDSLKLCKNNLQFLGIGASKLTNEKEFKKTLLRCNDTSEIRFLLLKPTHDLLKRAAKRAGVNEEIYETRVKTSLREIANIVNERGLKNIKVKFYERDPLLRLMFIDNSICLFSYNVLGKGDGSQLPQIHILTNSPDSEDTFFYPFKQYFESLWENYEEWNYKDYI